jgi:hypothetical protein
MAQIEKGRSSTLVDACRECPFRRDGIKHLGHRAEDIAKAICLGKKFHCHKTLELGDDGLETTKGKPCVGALMSLADMDVVMSVNEFVSV